MKRLPIYFRTLVLFVIFACTSVSSYASHILGADLYYTWVSGNTYKITLVLYGDCDPSSSTAFNLLSSTVPEICIKRGTTQVTSIGLPIQAPASGIDITPVCPGQGTSCQSASSPIHGIKKFVYSANYTLPAPVTSNCWQFCYFGGYVSGGATTSGRSAAVTNIATANTTIQLVDTLNNTTYPNNSSTQFTVIPTPFYCLNTPSSYNPGCVDPDGDLLNISLIPAKDGSTTCAFGATVAYTGTAWTPPNTPVSGATPLRVTAGTFNFNNSTGQLSFTPNAIQRATVVYNVREFRGGSFVGNCQREMNFLVQTCTNPPPFGGIDSSSGGGTVVGDVYTMCTNVGPFNIYLNPRASNPANTITVTSSGVPAGASLVVTGNGTTTPAITFSWTSVVAPGTYVFYLTYTDNNCPLSGTMTKAITINITPAPIVNTAIIAPATCVGKGAINIIPSGTGAPWNITITGAGGFTQTFTGINGPFVDSLMSGNYTVAISSAVASSCNSSSTITVGTTSIGVTASIIAPASCIRKAAVSIVPSGPGAPWDITVSGSPSHTFTGVTGAIIDSLAPGTYTIVVSPSTSSACVTSTSISVTVVAGPPNLASNAPICADSTLQLFNTDTASSFITYNWAGPNGFTSAVQNPTIPNAQVNASGVYTLTLTNGTFGCVTSDTIHVTIKPTPPAPVVTSNAPICDGTALNMNAASTAGSTYSWDGPGGFVSNIQSPAISPATIANTGSYTVVATLNGCPSIPGVGTFTVFPIPPAPLGVDTSYCQKGTAVPLNGTGASLLWYDYAAGGTGAPAAPTPFTDTAIGLYTWYTTQTINGCESPRTPVNVTILYTPVFSITAKTPICLHDSIVLSYTGLPLNTPDFSWTIPAGAATVDGNDSAATAWVHFDDPKTFNITLTAGNYGGRCVSTASKAIEVVEPPLSHFYVKPDFCLGDTVVVALTDRSPSATIFNWDFAGATIITQNSNSGGPYSLMWTDAGIHTIKMQSVSDIGCITPPVFDTFMVHANPDARIKRPDSIVCLEDTVSLSAMTNEYANTYTWEPAHFFNSANAPASNNQSTVKGRIEVSGYVTLTVTDPFGCTATDQLYVDPSPCCNVGFPNAFTPNGDMLNDVFRPILNGFHRFHVFRIVNRWGQTVFASTDNNATWDGTMNGVPQDVGVYYYYLKYDCGTQTREAKGDVTLIR